MVTSIGVLAVAATLLARRNMSKSARYHKKLLQMGMESGISGRKSARVTIIKAIFL